MDDHTQFGNWFSRTPFFRDTSGWIDTVSAAQFYELTLDGAIDYSSPQIRLAILKVALINGVRSYTVELTDRLNYMIYDIYFRKNGTLGFLFKNGRPATGSIGYIKNLVNFLTDS